MSIFDAKNKGNYKGQQNRLKLQQKQGSKPIKPNCRDPYNGGLRVQAMVVFEIV